MKLTKEALKRIIKEELKAVLDEARIKPVPPTILSPEHMEKIHSLIDSGDESFIDMARSLVDGQGGDSNYVDQYIEYHQLSDAGYEAFDPSKADPKFKQPWGSKSRQPSIPERFKERFGMNPRQLILKQLGEDNEAYREALQTGNADQAFWFLGRVEDGSRDLELIDQGWDHYQVMKLRSERLSQEPPRPEY
jgi:hypothetical protein